MYTRHHKSTPADRLLLALLHTACHHEYPHETVRPLLPSLSARLDHRVTDRAWERALSRHLTLAHSPKAHSPSEITSHLAARLLALVVGSSKPGGGAGGVRNRALAAALFLKVLETGPGTERFISSPIVSIGEFGVRLGVKDRGVARPWVRDAERRKVLHRVGERKGSAQAWKLPYSPNVFEWQVEAADLASLIDPAAPVTELGAAVLAVQHPGLAWAPGVRNPHFIWAMLMADALGVSPTVLGLTARTTIPAAKEALDRFGLTGLAGQALLDRLDVLAETVDPATGLTPNQRRDAAEAARVAQAEIRKRAVLDQREVVDRARAEQTKVQAEELTAQAATIDQTGLLPDWYDSADPGTLEQVRKYLLSQGILLRSVDHTAGTWSGEVDAFGSGPTVRRPGRTELAVQTSGPVGQTMAAQQPEPMNQDGSGQTERSGALPAAFDPAVHTERLRAQLAAQGVTLTSVSGGRWVGRVGG